MRRPEDLADVEWGDLQTSGPCGLFLFVLGLGWWLVASGENRAAVLEAIADVMWVLENAPAPIPPSGPKK